MAQIIPMNSKLQIRCKAGTLSSGADQIKSVTLAGVSRSAEAAALAGVSSAVAGLIDWPVVETLRVDTSVVEG